MKHLDSGDLRRMLDEPQGFDDAARLHAQSCEECRAKRALIASDAQHAAGVLSGELTLDAVRAYDRVVERLERPAARVRWYPVAAAVAAAFALALLFTPLGGYARSFLTIFEPQQFVPISVSSSDLRRLRLMRDADQIGTQRVVRKPERVRYATLTAAEKHASVHVLVPRDVPAQFRNVPFYYVISPGEMTFTFSAAKARAFAKKSHNALPPMPAGLDGTTVRVQTGQGFSAHYEQRSAERSQHAPSLEVFEMPVPRVSSTGASLATLERYVLSMPNVSPKLAAQIRALGNIENTVPVPVVIDKQHARNVTVQGVNGLAVGDNTGLGAGVMWQKNGTIYIIAGSLSMDDALAVANGLR